MKVKMEDVCERGSSNLKQSDIVYDSGNYPIYGASGYIGNVDFYHQDKPYVAVVKDGAGIGRTTLHPAKSSVIGTMQYLIPKKNVLPEYLYYVVRYMHLEKYFTGATIPHIYFKDYKNEQFNLDSLEKQKEIIDILKKCESVINAREKELQKLDKLIRARFVEMFEGRGKVVLLTNYVWFQEGPGVRSVDFAVEGTNLLTGSNINDNELSFGYKSDRFISNELANGKYAHFMCDKDDILVVSSAIAPEKFDQKVVIVEEDKKYCLNTGIIRFKPNREVMTLGYFREFLKTDYFKHQVMAEMRGIAQMHFGPSHLKQMTILLPESMEQQIEFEKFITQVNKSKLLAASQPQIHIYKTLTLL